MAKFVIDVPDGKRAVWVNDVLTLVDNLPDPEHKYNIGDKVRITTPQTFHYKDNKKCDVAAGTLVTIIDTPHTYTPEYTVKMDGAIGYVCECGLCANNTQRIKTFDDACQWCVENGYEDMVTTYNIFVENVHSYLPTHYVKDVDAYLQLRIITTALNEGLSNDRNCYSYVDTYDIKNNRKIIFSKTEYQLAGMLLLNDLQLSDYSTKQFANIYKDFCFNQSEK